MQCFKILFSETFGQAIVWRGGASGGLRKTWVYEGLEPKICTIKHDLLRLIMKGNPHIQTYNLNVRPDERMGRVRDLGSVAKVPSASAGSPDKTFRIGTRGQMFAIGSMCHRPISRISGG